MTDNLPDRIDEYLNNPGFVRVHTAFRAELEVSSGSDWPCTRTELKRWFGDPREGDSRSYILVAFGLPFRAMQYEESVAYERYGGSGEQWRPAGLHGGYPWSTLDEQSGPSVPIRGYRVYPVAPIPLGFAINTFLYALLLCGLLLAPRRLRRRSRRSRGLCLKCAYPIGASQLCTECGADVSAQRQAAPPSGK